MNVLDKVAKGLMALHIARVSLKARACGEYSLAIHRCEYAMQTVMWKTHCLCSRGQEEGGSVEQAISRVSVRVAPEATKCTMEESLWWQSGTFVPSVVSLCKV